MDLESESTEKELISLKNIVKYFFNRGLFSDIECRKIVYSNEVSRIHKRILLIIVTKTFKLAEQILEVYRCTIHPLQDNEILKRIFSYVSANDLINCTLVCKNWKTAVGLRENKITRGNEIKELLVMLITERGHDGKESQEIIEEDDVNSQNDECEITSHEIDDSIEAVQSNHIFTDPRMNTLITKVLLNHTVLTNIFRLLSLEDIKNNRLVCWKWYSAAEPFLRKLSIVKFNWSFTPENFINIFNYLPLPDLPFTAFKFTTEFYTSQLTDFFTKHGTIIKTLQMGDFFTSLPNEVPMYLSQTLNLTELDLEGPDPYHYGRYTPKLILQYETLFSIKSLCLRNSAIVIADTTFEENSRKITPLKIRLANVRFFIDDTDFYPGYMTLNDFVNFSEIKELEIESMYSGNQSFDWAREKFNADRMTFSNVRFVNEENSLSTVNHLKLYRSKLFATNMNIKELVFGYGEINLSILPSSVEKLSINKYCTVLPVTHIPYLPHLKYVFWMDSLNLLSSHFENCPNLSDLEITASEIVDITWLPRTVRRIAIQSRNVPVEFVGGEPHEYFDLDLLILKNFPTNEIKDLNFDKVRPKVVVALLYGAYYNDDAFVSFVQRNEQIQNLYVHYDIINNSGEANNFEGSLLSQIVDNESEFYLFANGQGIGINNEYFRLHSKIEEFGFFSDFLTFDRYDG